MRDHHPRRALTAAVTAALALGIAPTSGLAQSASAATATTTTAATATATTTMATTTTATAAAGGAAHRAPAATSAANGTAPAGHAMSDPTTLAPLPSPPLPAQLRAAAKQQRSDARLSTQGRAGAELNAGTATAASSIRPVELRGVSGANARTLVLYDTTGEFGWLGELYAIAGANLATHFGSVTVKPVGAYTPGDLARYNAAMYFGSTYGEPLPQAFLEEVRSGTTPVIWSGFNVWQLAGTTGSPEHAAFVATYGWDALASPIDAVDPVGSVRYKGGTLTRNAELNRGGLLVPKIVSADTVQVLATAVCGDPAAPSQCDPVAQVDGSELPWAVRSANLTYVGEIPFSYMSETDRYLAFADLPFALLAPGAAPVRRAAVRLEDVSANSDPAQLRAAADYLASAGVPFSVAVIPEFRDPKGVTTGGRPTSSTILSPQIWSALLYLRSRGGTLLQHGTSHQVDGLANPYDQVSGNDFEFYSAICTENPTPPYTRGTCDADTSWVRLVGPVGSDSTTSWALRVARGRSLFAWALLPTPTIFETPHYTASPNAYRAIGSQYSTRYERVQYYGGLLGGTADTSRVFGQFFPYRVRDVYGTTVLPENLGNYEPVAFQHNPARLPADIVDNAKANLVVTHATASFFFHPYLPVSELKATVEGIKAAGYTFVAASQLP